MFVLTTVTRDCKNGDLYVSVDDNAYLTKEAASAALRASYEDFLTTAQAMKTEMLCLADTASAMKQVSTIMQTTQIVSFCPLS